MKDWNQSALPPRGCSADWQLGSRRVALLALTAEKILGDGRVGEGPPGELNPLLESQRDEGIVVFARDDTPGAAAGLVPPAQRRGDAEVQMTGDDRGATQKLEDAMRGFSEHDAGHNMQKSHSLSMWPHKIVERARKIGVSVHSEESLGSFPMERIYKRLVAEWVAEGLRKPGKKQADLAKALNVNQSQIARLISGERSLRAEEVAAVERYLDLPFPYAQISGLGAGVRDVSDMGSGSMPVRYRVQAGVWMEADSAVDEAIAEIPFHRDPAYPPTRQQYAVQVVGESMNKTLPDGSFAIVVAADGQTPQHNDLVIVKRTHRGLVERTIKRYVVSRNAVELRPESTDSRFKPLPLIEEPDTTIEIEGFVVGRYDKFSR